MSNNKMEMLGRVMEKLMSSVMDLNTIYDLLDKLDNADWRAWLAELKKFLRKEPCWVKLDLLYRGADLEKFLWVVRTTLVLGERWTEGHLMSALQHSPRVLEFNGINMAQLYHFVMQMDALGVTCLLVSREHKNVMSPVEFEEAFGVSLPIS